MAVHAEDRPQSAKELSRRLAEVGGIEPSTDEPARDWWEAHEPITRA